MSVAGPLPAPAPPFDLAAARKRTSSFSTPPAYKAPRTALKRTASYLLLPQIIDTPPPFAPGATRRASTSTAHLPISKPARTPAACKESKRRLGRAYASIDLTLVTATRAHTPPTPSPPPAPHALARAVLFTGSAPVPVPAARPRTPSACTSAPPTRRFLPPRAHYPRPRPPTDLHRQALLARMRCSPAGAQILRMGARLAVAMLTATAELERLVAAQERDGDMDVECAGGGGGAEPWVVVPQEDWEMVDSDTRQCQ